MYIDINRRSMNALKSLLLFFCHLWFISGSDTQNNQCPGLSFTVNPDAVVKFSVITTVRRTTDGMTCGNTISPAAVEQIAAMTWVVDRLNSNNFTIKIGIDVYDDCGIPRNTISRALQVLDTPVLGTAACLNSNSTACSIGIIGAGGSKTTEAMLYALQGSEVPVLGPYATFHNLSRYSNYYRTIATDDKQVEATAELLSKLGLRYVAVVYQDTDIGTYSANQLKTISKSKGICIDSVQKIQNGPELNRTLLKQQRDKTKYRSLRVVFFGTREVYRKMQAELNFYETEMYNISWVVVEQTEDSSPAFGAKDSLKPGTIIVAPALSKIDAVVEFIRNRSSSIEQPSDDLGHLIKCAVFDGSNVSTSDNAATVDSVFMFAMALQRLSMLYCNGQMCDILRGNFDFKLEDVRTYPINYADLDPNITVEEFVDGRRVTNFQINGDYLPGSTTELYEVKIVGTGGTIAKVGSYRNNSITLLNSSMPLVESLPSSLCYEDCAICSQTSDISFAYLQGDTFILGIFAVHETDPDDPFRCSNFRTSQMDVVIIETFLHTVKRMRDETGIQFGAIAVDDCYSSAQTDLVLSQIFSGEVTLTNPVDGSVIQVNRIAAVVMTVSSSVTIPVSFLMTELNVPVISASASSPDLDDRINFPYFLRTVPSDLEQAKAMISIIKRMEWEYVSLLYVENNYGSKGKEALEKLANESKVCVAQFPEGIPDVKDETSDSLLKSVFTELSNHRADIVIYFGTEARIADFLKAIDGQNEFIFLGSEDWGDRQYILDSGKSATLGSLTLKNEVQSLADDPLADYLRGLRHDMPSKAWNPWFVQYWEEYFQCDTETSFRNVYNKPCDETSKFSEQEIQEFVSDHRIVHTSKAVKAIAHGLKKSKEQLCQFDNVFPCPKYFQYVSDVVDHIRNVSLKRENVDVRVFKDDGNGNVGFVINNVQQGVNGALEYVEVGSYKEGVLDLQKNKLNFYPESRRNFDGACIGNLCGHCSNISTTTAVPVDPRTQPQNDPGLFGAPDYTILGILGGLVLMVLIMTIVIICIFKRRIKVLQVQVSALKYEIRTGYDLHQRRASQANMNTVSLTYPDLQFANRSPSGETMYEWNKAQYALKGGSGNLNNANGGVVNKGFVGSEMYLHATNQDEDNQQSTSSVSVTQSSPRRQNSNADQSNSFPDSPVYRPSSASYGISTHSSFKKPANDYNGQGHIKKQPRTQLAVPPCRPELPPRDPEQNRAHAQRPTGFKEAFDHLPSAVPKEKVRKGRGSPKRTVSPPSFKQDTALQESPRHRELPKLDSSYFNGAPKNLPSPGKVDLTGSVERISRV